MDTFISPGGPAGFLQFPQELGSVSSGHLRSLLVLPNGLTLASPPCRNPACLPPQRKYTHHLAMSRLCCNPLSNRGHLRTMGLMLSNGAKIRLEGDSLWQFPWITFTLSNLGMVKQKHSSIPPSFSLCSGQGETNQPF